MPTIAIGSSVARSRSPAIACRRRLADAAARAERRDPSCSASIAGVGQRKSTVAAMALPCARTRAAAPAARSTSSELPPSSKKLSCRRRRSRPSKLRATPSQMRCSYRRGGARRPAPAPGALRPAPAARGDRACRSPSPAARRGARSARHHELGQARARYARNAVADGRLAPATKYATSRLSPGWSPRATTAHDCTRRVRASAASISPSSMRKPRILTWLSARPTNSIAPSSRQRTRSPVRYRRSPCGAETDRRRSARRSAPAACR